MTGSSIVSSTNPNFGTVQTTTFTDLIESLPNYYAAFLPFGETVDLMSGRAESHLIRSYKRVSVTDNMMIPLNPNILNGAKTVDLDGSVIVLNPAEYGISFILSERTRVNTPEDIGAAISPLISDYVMQLKEKITKNKIMSANKISIEFTNGGSGTPRKANAADFINASMIMEANGATPCVDFVRATDQVRSTPVGKSFVLITSVQGHGAIKKNLSADEFFCVHQFAGIADYALASKGSINRANIDVLVSSAMTVGDPAERIGILLANQPFFKTGQTPLTSRTLIRPASESNFGYHSMIQHIVSFDVALSSQNRVGKVIYAD